MNPDDTVLECPDECYGRVEGCWVIPDVYTVLRGCRLYPGSHPDHSYNVVVLVAAQPSKDGRLGGSPQNSYAGRHPSKRFVQGERRIPSVSNLILPKVGELMVNNQQYDSHVGRLRQVSLECFIVDRSTPCLRARG